MTEGDNDMHDHDCGGQRRNREAWRFEREAKRAAWRARRAARHAGQGDWSHFGDPKFWGLDAESMRQWGFGTGAGASVGSGANFGMPPSAADHAALKAQVAEMETTIDSMQERIVVLEKLILDLDKEARDARLAAEIEKLRDRPEGAE
jgi:hypothetical protein